MGCDIHLHIEIKLDGIWHHYGNPKIKRDYWLFEKMAGVRGKQENAIVAPKGLPDDVTPVTALSKARMGNDAHTPSWLNVKEIQTLVYWLNQRTDIHGRMDLENDLLQTYLFSDAFVWEGKVAVEGVQDVRFVFWFDN